MEKQISFQKFSKILKFGMKVINPFDGAGDEAKLTRLYRFFIASHLSMILGSAAFCMLEDPDLHASTEAAVIVLSYMRSILYMMMMITRSSKWQASLGKIVDERKSVSPRDEKSFDLTVEYCNDEARLSIFGFVTLCCFIAIALIFGPLLHLNDLRLIFNFYIPGLRFEGVGWKWFLSYTFQAINGCSFGAFFIAFLPLTMLLMSQVCFKVDEAILLVEQLNKSLVDFSSDKPPSDETEASTSHVIKNVVVVDLKATPSGAIKKFVDETKATTSRAIKKVEVVHKKAKRNAEVKELSQRIAEMITSVNEWREESQDLMRLSFLIDFMTLSFSFSLSLFAITENFTDSLAMLLGLCVLLFQLFLYCWSGTRLSIRVERLASSLYDIEWQEMNVKEQKDLLLMLTMTQNIGGFDGVFKRVNFETFKEILNFSYSLFSFLRAINLT